MTGTAISFQASDKEELFVSLIKQATWDDKTKRGSFIANRNKPGFSMVIKFNQIEAGSMLDALEKFYEFKAFHSSANSTTQISFAPSEDNISYVFKAHQTNKQDTTKKASFFIPISFGESRLIREYLIHYLHKSFTTGNKSTAAKKEEEPQPETGAPASPEPEQPPPAPEEAAPSVGSDW